MKAQQAITATAGTKTPFWVKASASTASLAMLLAISSYNVVPTIRRAIDGDVPAIGLAAVQISFTIILAVIPFVPGWSTDTRKLLTLAFMLGNGWFAYEIAGHRHDGERTANNQHNAIQAELNDKKDERSRLGDFKATDDYEVVFAQDAVRAADLSASAAHTSVNAASTQLATCVKRCTALIGEVKRLDGEAKQKDSEARTAHDELQRISGLRTLTAKAAPINARIDKLQKKLNEEQFVSDTASTSETARTFEAALIAILIELGNRFGPEAIFKFLFFAAGVSLLVPSHVKESTEERKAAPVPSIVLPAVPHVEEVAAHEPATAPEEAIKEPAAAIMPDEESAPWDAASEAPGRHPGMFTEFRPPAPVPPRKRTKPRKPESKAAEVRPDNVVPFRRSVADEVHAMIEAGRKQKEVAAVLGVTDRHVRRIMSASKSGHVRSQMSASMSAS